MLIEYRKVMVKTLIYLKKGAFQQTDELQLIQSHILHGIPKNYTFVRDYTQNQNNRFLTKKWVKVENESERMYKIDR